MISLRTSTEGEAVKLKDKFSHACRNIELNVLYSEVERPYYLIVSDNPILLQYSMFQVVRAI